MAKLRPFQTNLTRGELSQFIYSRPDLGAYQNGAEILENVIVLPEGGVRRRSGLRVVTEVKDSTRPVILIPHIRSQDLSYIVECGAYYLRFYKGNVPIYDLSGPELLINGGFNSDTTSWAGSGIVIWLPEGKALLVGVAGGSSELSQATLLATIGETYTASFDVTFGPVDVYLTGSDKNYWQRFSVGHNVVNFIAATTTPGIIFRTADNTAVDNVSIKHNATIIELETPYADSELGFIHWIQSIDVLFMQHPNHGTAKLSNASDYQWTFSAINFNPPPSIEDSPSGTALGGGTLTLSATVGFVTVNADNPAFLYADQGRNIVAFGGLYRGIITGFSGAQDVTVLVVGSPWPLTVGPDNWQLTGSPLTDLSIDKKEPLGAEATLATGVDAFRASDVGKFVRVWGGTIWIRNYDSAQQVRGTIVAVLSRATTDPPTSSPAGAWTIEVPAWSSTVGYPATIEFHQGRLVQAATVAQPTTVWGSASDNFENYALGSLPADSYAFTVRSGKANPITWLCATDQLLMGESDNSAPIQPIRIGTAVRYAKGPGVDEPIGGANIPFVGTSKGQIFYVNAMRTELRQLRYDLQQDGLMTLNVNILGRHLFDPAEGGSPIKQVAIAYAEKPNSVIYIVRDDGQLVALTHYEQEQVTAFTRLVTDGAFESVAVVPKPNYHQVWCIVRRTLGGRTVRMIEYFEDHHELLQERKYPELLTDCATIVVHDAGQTSTIVGAAGQLTYLRGQTVDVIHHSSAGGQKSGDYVGSFVVADDDTITLGQTFDAPGMFEVGLRFSPTIRLVRPASAQQNMEGIPRRWNRVWARIKDTVGLSVNGEPFDFTQIGQPLAEGPQPMTDDIMVMLTGWSTSNELTFSQTWPGPLTLLGVFGTITLGED